MGDSDHDEAPKAQLMDGGVAWMHDNSKKVDLESYLLGKRIDDFVDPTAAENTGNTDWVGGTGGDVQDPGDIASRAALFKTKDAFAKAREDPMFVIEKQKRNAKVDLRNDPLRMQKIRELLAAELKKDLKKKKKKKSSKKERSTSPEAKQTTENKRRSVSPEVRQSVDNKRRKEGERRQRSPDQRRDEEKRHSRQAESPRRNSRQERRRHDTSDTEEKQPKQSSRRQGEDERGQDKPRKRHDTEDTEAQSPVKRSSKSDGVRKRHDTSDNESPVKRSSKHGEDMKERKQKEDVGRKRHDTSDNDSPVKRKREKSPKRKERRSEDRDERRKEKKADKRKEKEERRNEMKEEKPKSGLLDQKGHWEAPKEVPTAAPRRPQQNKPFKRELKPKMSAEEMERRRAEMMQDAEERDVARRGKYVKSNDVEDTINNKEGGAHFVQNLKVAAYSSSSSTVEGRIKSGIFSKQRTKADLSTFLSR